ncbi:hypothetical protein CI109_103105 [Kwoniella shandongensis]|uniref:Uncharacterized protein n=1 Tax=Kwoniella shandongensis TaxID=1734106 RepID=A0A5M6CDD0_9TREE|nr:uncharacterized protein CI109_000296 [Kwoniella shandongensis]KAA5531455.1 hypothetical protein CI109_000296 [Kwoniella shandongensis]
MSINTVHLSQGNILPLQHGEDVLTAGHTADLELRIPATIQGPKRTENAKGRIWVTDHRVIFIADTLDTPGTSASGASAPSEPPSYDAPPVLSSLEIPYASLKIASYNLPTFSANNVLLTFIPAPGDTSLPDPGRGQTIEAKVIVGEGAGHGVWKRIEGERMRAEERRKQEDILPAYEPRN